MLFRKQARGVGLHKTFTEQTVFLEAPDIECGVEIFSDFTGDFWSCFGVIISYYLFTFPLWKESVYPMTLYDGNM